MNQSDLNEIEKTATAIRVNPQSRERLVQQLQYIYDLGLHQGKIDIHNEIVESLQAQLGNI